MKKLESFLSEAEKKAIVNAIEEAEKNTSGEILVHIESKTEKPPLERAKEVFLSLNLHKTKLQNAVLFYLSVENQKFAILGDVGIDKVVPDDFWEEAKQLMLNHLSNNKVEQALVAGIRKVGKQLQEYFPHQEDDTNELSDTISFGN